ncbi:Nucleobase-ascorbate transporter 1 [Camellia lanceoleosa]|uniref:Nucleobase-ascorbate transporter 1 n=1 Tax=Camellia lanceoleosa TaxID=1840588 RepID=A0ACC0IN76_9ERIC|nr:Nucleobase-ascorbate transporter 1 [Camellia lanceoleosa]
MLAFQNYILMLGTTVMIPAFLVPLMGGTNGDKARVIQTLLFVAGINTLLQALFGTKLAVVVGGSYAYAISILYIINDSSLQQISEPHAFSLQFLQSSWYGACGWIGWFWVVSTRISCEIGIPMLLLVIGLSQIRDLIWTYLVIWRADGSLFCVFVHITLRVFWLCCNFHIFVSITGHVW